MFQKAIKNNDENLSVALDVIPLLGGISREVEDAQVHCPGVQIDPTAESVLLVIETHHGLLWHGSGRLSPSWAEGTHFRIHFRPRPRP
jgi:hypothetical protein